MRPRRVTVTRSEAMTPIGPTASQRLDVKLAYRGRSWQTVRLEIAPAEGAAGQDVDPVAGVPLDHLGLEALERVPCVSVRYQIAQKVHACTSTPGGRPNDRSRDLIDLLLLRDLIGARDLGRVREACVETFELRDLHAWPPTVVVMEPWRLTYPLEAKELDFDPLDVEVAAERVQRVIDEIDAARCRPLGGFASRFVGGIGLVGRGPVGFMASGASVPVFRHLSDVRSLVPVERPAESEGDVQVGDRRGLAQRAAQPVLDPGQAVAERVRMEVERRRRP